MSRDYSEWGAVKAGSQGEFKATNDRAPKLREQWINHRSLWSVGFRETLSPYWRAFSSSSSSRARPSESEMNPVKNSRHRDRSRGSWKRSSPFLNRAPVVLVFPQTGQKRRGEPRSGASSSPNERRTTFLISSDDDGERWSSRAEKKPRRKS